MVELYGYKATVVRVIDGDTVDVVFDLGFSIFSKQRIRFYGINTPESRGRYACAEGAAAKKFVESILTPGKEILIQTVKLKSGKDKKGKFGRYLGTIISDGTNLNELLVEKGHAKINYYK